MNHTKTAGLIGLAVAALFSFAAIPSYGPVLDWEASNRAAALNTDDLILPTPVPLNTILDDDLEANDDQATTLENTAVTIDVLANDEGVDPEGFSLSILDPPENGNASIQSGGMISYTPVSGFTGEDEFKYEVCNSDDDDDDDDDDDEGDGEYSVDDDDEDCDKADVLVIVDLAPVANEQPFATNDIYSIGQGIKLAAPVPGVLANDSDPNGDALTAVVVGPVENGSLAFNPDGSFSYTPAEGFIGVDTFTYQANDGEFLSNLGTVEIEVIDTEPPTVAWLSPGSDGEVFDVGYEMVHLEVVASDNGSIDRVHFFRWDAQNELFVDIAEVTQAPYAVDFHSSILNYEWNQVLARVYDTAGNVSGNVFIWIYQNVNGSKVFLPSVIR